METQNNQNLILKYLKKDITEKELETFKESFKDSDFEQTFYQYRDIWERPIKKKSNGFKKYRSLEKLNQKINFYESQKKSDKKNDVLIKYLFKAAAAILIFVIPLSLIYRSEVSNEITSLQNITLSTKKR